MSKHSKRRLCAACLRPIPFTSRQRTCSPDCERRLRLTEVRAPARALRPLTVAGVTVPALDDWAGVDENANPCYYCGDPADTVDHVVPRSVIESITDSGVDDLIAAALRRRRRLLVPACRECNTLAGAKYHETLAERTDYVRERLARKYRKALAMPDWSASELVDLSDGLRGLVINGLYERDLIRRRLRYRARGLTPMSASVRGIA